MDNCANISNGADSGLKPVEAEVIELFVQYCRALGQPRSVAEIYGLLFVSHVPLSQIDLEKRLQISKGSTCMGLQILEELGAVRVVNVPNQRRTHYEAVAELRNLIGSFLRQRVSTHLSGSENRLERIHEQAQSLTGEAKDHALARVKLLKSWTKNGRRALPFLLKMLGGK